MKKGLSRDYIVGIVRRIVYPKKGYRLPTLLLRKKLRLRGPVFARRAKGKGLLGFRV